jgi:hypothetical protein
MSVPIGEVIFQIGTVEQRRFSKDCETGDTEIFNIRFPTPFPTQMGIRVIVTANNSNVPRGAHNAAVVGIVQNVTTDGFVLRARNSDCADAGGFAGMNWMAVLETPGTQQKSVNLRMGILQPQPFSSDCYSGDTRDFGASFSSSLDSPPIALVTANNLNVQGHNAAAVGTVLDPSASGFTLKARNSDCAAGGCAFYYVALSQGAAGRGDLIADTGEVYEQSFLNDCNSGDTRNWDVYFNQPFLTPPVVLVAAYHSKLDDVHPAAAVGMARNVTPHGFTLVGRNSDCFGPTGLAGPVIASAAGFYWVAIGCAPGCG